MESVLYTGIYISSISVRKSVAKKVKIIEFEKGIESQESQKRCLT